MVASPGAGERLSPQVCLSGRALTGQESAAGGPSDASQLRETWMRSQRSSGGSLTWGVVGDGKSMKSWREEEGLGDEHRCSQVIVSLHSHESV